VNGKSFCPFRDKGLFEDLTGEFDLVSFFILELEFRRRVFDFGLLSFSLKPRTTFGNPNADLLLLSIRRENSKVIRGLLI